MARREAARRWPGSRTLPCLGGVSPRSPVRDRRVGGGQADVLGCPVHHRPGGRSSSAGPRVRDASSPASAARSCCPRPRRPTGSTTRSLDPENLRSILARLTDPGRELVDRAVADHVDDERRILGPLGPDDRTLLDGLLRRLLAGVEDP